MNKAAIYFVIALFFASSAFALGIGARNTEIVAIGNQTAQLFIVNDEFRNLSVDIVVAGPSDGVEVIPSSMQLSPDVYLQEFNVLMDFDKIRKYPIEIRASEISEAGGQLSAVVNVVYKLPVRQYSGNSAGGSKDEKAENQQNSFAPAQESEISGNLAMNATEKPDTITKQISGAAAAEGNEIPDVDFTIHDSEKGYLIFGVVLIIVCIIIFNIFFIKRKTPLEKYILTSRKMGSNDEEISSKLREAGWDELTIESSMRK